jgi:phosphoglucosamine mutase
MARQFFGTDGIRGQANSEPMTAETALKVGLATAAFFRRGAHRHRVVIGKDTRLSGYLIEPALTAGFIAGGMDTILVGPLPTPAVAMLTRSLRCDLGVMISASHNPWTDNGIKLFGPDGFKLSDEAELAIEAMIEGAVLAVLVVLLFLRDWRATLISAIAIPLSAIPAFWFMDLMGFTLNGVSLIALSLVLIGFCLG